MELDRRREIVVSAAGLFLRYGFRKTSMDDVARAAKLSRQGLYFHFSNKEEVFRAVIEHVAEVTLTALQTALAPSEQSLEERLLAGFAAMSEETLGCSDPANVQELFAAAKDLVGDVVQRLDEQIVLALAKTLKREQRARVSAGHTPPLALAEHLYATSYGLKHRGHIGEDYLDRMRVAVRVVCKSEGL